MLQPRVIAADYDGDGDTDMYVTGHSGQLYRNDGGHFTNVTSSAGVRSGGVQSADWGYYDSDSGLDLFVPRGALPSNVDYSEASGGERGLLREPKAATRTARLLPPTH